MKRILSILLLSVIACFLSVPVWSGSSTSLSPTALTETRYCFPIQRDANGRIIRSAAVVAAFKREHPCPSTGLTYGPCPGWQINHVIPLACGGCDAVSNMDWMPVEIKTCSAPTCRDRFELKIYGRYAGTVCTAPPIN